jgi:outer membrane biosynthesis protein TonB
MTPRSAPSWRRLAPLAVAVLAVHLLALIGPPQVRTAHKQSLHFRTRAITPAAPAAPPVQPAAAPVVAQTPPPPRPRQPLPERAPAPPAKQEAPQPQAAPAPVAASENAAAPEATSAPPAPANTFALPAPTSLRYQVTVKRGLLTLNGDAHLDWRHDGEQYEARLELSSPGLPARVQRSVGKVTEEGLAPSYFSDKSRSEQATHFDRDQGRIVFSNNSPQAPLAPGIQDRLSIVMQVAALVRGDPARFIQGTWINMPTAGSREAENWYFSVEFEEDLDLPGGKVRALRLLRLPRKDFDQQLELWLAPLMDYAPVRVRLTNPNGDTVDQRWSSTDRE